MAPKHLIWSAVLIVTWLTFCDSTGTQICHYVKGPWGECDPATKKQSVQLTLLNGNSTCRPTKVETEDCTPGSSPFRQPEPAKNLGNVRTLLQSREPLVLGMGHEDLVGDGTTQCLKSSYQGRSATNFYQFIYYSQREKNRNGNHEWTDRAFHASYTVAKSGEQVTLNVAITDSNREERPISGTYTVVYSTRKCFVLSKELGNSSGAPCVIWMLLSTFRKPPPDCTTAFDMKCKGSKDVPIYKPYPWLCLPRWGLTQ